MNHHDAYRYEYEQFENMSIDPLIDTHERAKFRCSFRLDAI
jgi:hypothetical protein